MTKNVRKYLAHPQWGIVMLVELLKEDKIRGTLYLVSFTQRATIWGESTGIILVFFGEAMKEGRIALFKKKIGMPKETFSWPSKMKIRH